MTRIILFYIIVSLCGAAFFAGAAALLRLPDAVPWVFTIAGGATFLLLCFMGGAHRGELDG